MKQFETGSKVQWDWGDGTASGTIKESYTEEITKEIDGTEVTREADSENPAYLIEQEDGQQVLKSHSELESTNK